MRLRIFRSYSNNGKPYFTLTTKAYQHEDSKLKWFIKFSKNCVEPIVKKGISNNREYEYVDVDVQDAFLGNTAMYNDMINPVLTINSYVEVKDNKDDEQIDMEQKVEDFKKENNIGIPEVKIEQDSLPFY